MILQIRYFSLITPPSPKKPTAITTGSAISTVEEISFDTYQQRLRSSSSISTTNSGLISNRCTVVHEVAFGPVGDIKTRPPCIYFDLPNGCIRTVSLQEVKRSKRENKLSPKKKNHISPTKSPSLQRHNMGVGRGGGGGGGELNRNKQQEHQQKSFLKITSLATKTLSPHHQHFQNPPFIHYTGIDATSSALIDKMLHHRLRTLKTNKKLSKDEKKLQQEYQSITKHFRFWTWPVVTGRESDMSDKNDESTLVPDVMSEYHFRLPNKKKETNDVCRTTTGRHAVLATGFIWKSFVRAMETHSPLVVDRNDTKEKRRKKEDSGSSMPSHDRTYAVLKRLKVLRSLSCGMTIGESSSNCNGTALPKLVKNGHQQKQNDYFLFSEPKVEKEWTIVRDFYTKNNDHNDDIDNATTRYGYDKENDDNKTNIIGNNLISSKSKNDKSTDYYCRVCNDGNVYKEKNIPLSVVGNNNSNNNNGTPKKIKMDMKIMSPSSFI